MGFNPSVQIVIIFSSRVLTNCFINISLSVINVLLLKSWSSREKPDFSCVGEEPVITAVDDGVVIVISVNNLIISFWIPPKFNVSVSILVKSCSSIGVTVSSNERVGDEIFIVIVALVIDGDWIEKVSCRFIEEITSSDALDIFFIPKILVSVDFVPGSLVSFRLEVTNWFRTLWTETKFKTKEFWILS